MPVEAEVEIGAEAECEGWPVVLPVGSMVAIGALGAGVREAVSCLVMSPFFAGISCTSEVVEIEGEGGRGQERGCGCFWGRR